MSLLYLSLTRWTKKLPRVFTNAERLVELRIAMQARPGNSFDWEAIRRNRTASPAANIVPIRKSKSARSVP